MRYYQTVYFVTIIFTTFIGWLLHIFTKVPLFECLSFGVSLYILYHLLEWKYREEEDDV